MPSNKTAQIAQKEVVPILGLTQSGKPVYFDKWSNSKEYKDFSAQDHRDACVLHHTANATEIVNKVAHYAHFEDHSAKADRLTKKSLKLSFEKLEDSFNYSISYNVKLNFPHFCFIKLQHIDNCQTSKTAIFEVDFRPNLKTYCFCAVNKKVLCDRVYIVTKIVTIEKSGITFEFTNTKDFFKYVKTKVTKLEKR